MKPSKKTRTVACWFLNCTAQAESSVRDEYALTCRRTWTASFALVHSEAQAEDSSNLVLADHGFDLLAVSAGYWLAFRDKLELASGTHPFFFFYRSLTPCAMPDDRPGKPSSSPPPCLLYFVNCRVARFLLTHLFDCLFVCLFLLLLYERIAGVLVLFLS